MPKRRPSKARLHFHAGPPGIAFADLHVHTLFSDGSLSPVDLLQSMVSHGFAVAGITDHDTLDGIPEALRAGEQWGIEVIAGVEITCCIEDKELHLLGYFTGDHWQNHDLHAVLEHAKQLRAQRAERMVAKLNQAGVPLTVRDVMACSAEGTLGRPHVAMALHRGGFVGDVGEAFARYLRRGCVAYVDRHRITAAEAIRLIRRAGGAAVLAHPGLNQIDARIPELVDQGLDGLEVWHSRHSPKQVTRYLEMVDRLELLATGGSDCHGPGRGEALVGTVKIPVERAEALKARARKNVRSAGVRPASARAQPSRARRR